MSRDTFADLDLIITLANRVEGDMAEKINKVRVIFEELKSKKPANMRRIMDPLWTTIEQAENDYRRFIEKSDDITTRIDRITSLINEYNDATNALKIHMNKLQIGTLEGLSRDVIRRNRIAPDDEITQTVLKQSYDESEAMNRGGKKKRRKTRKTRKIRKK